MPSLLPLGQPLGEVGLLPGVQAGALSGGAGAKLYQTIGDRDSALAGGLGCRGEGGRSAAPEMQPLC